MAKQKVLILFGGVSAEHEVSVITGLQVAEQIDKELYEPHCIYIDKQGNPFYISKLENRREFLKAKRHPVTFGRDENGGYVSLPTGIGITIIPTTKIYPYAAYLAFHGGTGESGPVQGLCEVLGIPYTSPTIEASVITMNKALTNQVLQAAGLPCVPGKSYNSSEIQKHVESISHMIISELDLPVIIKPVHLGSSIGINIAKTEVELQKFLLEAAFVDSEILVEKFLTNFTEYNCSVRLIHNNLETSEIEKPISRDEILSFADKYQRGSNKKAASGMASLQRELPAKISPELKEMIQTIAKRVFEATRCKGMVRIDFMVTPDGSIYVTEVNPIPGSMAYYLWEASGISFTEQISNLIEQAVRDQILQKSRVMDYSTDIIERFIENS